MGYTAVDNYSVLNNYNYVKKTSVISALDWLSTPWRRILGGRNVCVISETHEHEMSTAKKVATLFFSILIFPIAAVSIASLVLKLATFPHLWEKKKIAEQSKKTWDIIDQFNKAFDNKQYGQAIKVLEEQPELQTRNEINTKLFKIINYKINDGDSWEEIQYLLPLLDNPEGIELINHAVKCRLQAEIKNDYYTLTAKDIMQFVQNSLKNKSIISIEACYKRLLTGSLQIDTSADIVLSCFKMDFADQMISSLIQKRVARARDQVEKKLAELEEFTLRAQVFKKDQAHNHYYILFRDSKDMKQISAAVQAIRDVSQLSEKALKKMNEIAADANLKAKAPSFRSELVQFKAQLASIHLKGEEKNYMHAIQKILDTLVSFLDSIEQAISVDDINTHASKTQAAIAKQGKKFPEFIKEIPISYLQTNLENTLAALGIKKKAILFIATQKMMQILLESIASEAIKPNLGHPTQGWKD